GVREGGRGGDRDRVEPVPDARARARTHARVAAGAGRPAQRLRARADRQGRLRVPQRRTMKRPRLVAVILAGGAGTRFWPLSRKKRPKPLLRAGGEASLLAEAVARAGRFAARRDVWLVCGADHASAMRREAGLAADRVLVEPAGRNTAPAIALAAL